MVDATFKINTFLNKHLCLFTQGLTYKNKNIKVGAEIFPSNPDGGNKHDDSEKRIDRTDILLLGYTIGTLLNAAYSRQANYELRLTMIKFLSHSSWTTFSP